MTLLLILNKIILFSWSLTYRSRFSIDIELHDWSITIEKVRILRLIILNVIIKAFFFNHFHPTIFPQHFM